MKTDVMVNCGTRMRHLIRLLKEGGLYLVICSGSSSHQKLSSIVIYLDWFSLPLSHTSYSSLLFIFSSILDCSSHTQLNIAANQTWLSSYSLPGLSVCLKSSELWLFLGHVKHTKDYFAEEKKEKHVLHHLQRSLCSPCKCRFWFDLVVGEDRLKTDFPWCLISFGLQKKKQAELQNSFY